LIESLVNIQGKAAHLDDAIALLKDLLVEAYKVDMEQFIKASDDRPFSAPSNAERSFSEHNSENQFKIEDLHMSKGLWDSQQRSIHAASIGSINQADEEPHPEAAVDDGVKGSPREGELLFEEQQLSAEKEPLRIT